MVECYSRMLIDNHITEDDPSFITAFDAQRYVSLVKQSGVDAFMIYACDHNGNCYYPTRVGHPHRNLHRHDNYGDLIRLVRQQGIHPIAYYTVVYHNHPAKSHPTWRMASASGQQHDHRYWWACPNSREYVEFTKSQLAEIIAYDIDGIFIDMTFWPVVCCCPNCREKFLKLTGKEIPEAIDWNNPDWVAFQRFRESSMVAYCQELAGFIKSIKPITVTFQNSPIIFGWSWGQTPGIANACDYTSADFYGGKYQHILGAKILAACSSKQPYEYMTSRCVNLNDHTSMKSEADLLCEASTTLASGGAYFFIDAINPDGSLNPAVYERLGRVSSHLAPFVSQMKHYRPTLSADTGLYFSMSSFIDPSLNGKALKDLEFSSNLAFTPPYEEMLGTSIMLTHAHRPFKVVRDAEGDLNQFKTLIINNAMVMSQDEVEKIKNFVAQGGTLLATGLTSLWRPDGSTSGDFALADVFGVSYTGKQSARINYLKLPGEQNLVSCRMPAPLVKPNSQQVEELAKLVEPIFDPDDPQHYASIHSNPPGRETGHPGLTIHNFGKGRCIYLAPPLLTLQQDAQESFGAWLLQKYAPSQIVLGTNAPVAVEVTLLKSTTSPNWLVCLVNYQKETPNIPVHGIHLSLRLPAGAATSCTCLSNGNKLPFQAVDGILSFDLPELNTLEMVEIQVG